MEKPGFISAIYTNHTDNVAWVWVTNKYDYSPPTVGNADRMSRKKGLAFKGTDWDIKL